MYEHNDTIKTQRYLHFVPHFLMLCWLGWNVSVGKQHVSRQLWWNFPYGAQGTL